MNAQSQNNCKHQEWRVGLLRMSAGFLSVVFHMLHEFSSCARDKLHRQRAPRQMTPNALPPMTPRSPEREEMIY